MRNQRSHSNAWALLPATKSLFQTTKIKLSRMGEWWKSNTVYICERDTQEGTKVTFLSSCGRLNSVVVGTRHEGRHDQTFAGMGYFTVVNIVDLVDGKIVAKENDLHIDIKAAISVFK